MILVSNHSALVYHRVIVHKGDEAMGASRWIKGWRQL